MADHATPNLPSRDFDATAAFYARLGFVVSWRDNGWMILERDTITLEFFPHPDLDPRDSWFSCCLRLDAVMAFFELAVAAGIPETSSGWPRLHRPQRESWGGLVGALVDPDGTLIRLIEE
jgi:hypothetical protein